MPAFAAKCICSFWQKNPLIWKWTCVPSAVLISTTLLKLWRLPLSSVCVYACMQEGGARARSHVGLVCTGCLVAFLVVCWSYCNSVVVVCLFADKSWPPFIQYSQTLFHFKLWVNKFIKLLESKEFCMHFTIMSVLWWRSQERAWCSGLLKCYALKRDELTHPPVICGSGALLMVKCSLLLLLWQPWEQMLL